MAEEVEEIKNKIAESGLVSIDLKDFYPAGARAVIDMKDHLFEGLILKEKDFRAFVKNEDWSKYQDKYVAITSTADAIIPTWAYMLLTSELQPYAKKVVCGTPETLETVLFHETILEKLKPEQYADKRVMIKGCGDVEIPASAFVDAVNLLKPFVKTIMYGEACSNVPIYKSRSQGA
ncbi:MAG TPA: DUF2480 family protein [Bacteroidia bacterium]|jgi:hypothetical protein|nr:DUF2480 family protein [Bacteroidia bacterium]